MGISRGTVAIIIPVRNGAKFLRQSLESVTKQTFKDLKCIVVDDGSTDLTYDIAREFAERDPRISVFRLARNMGSSYAFNAGLVKARGKYVAFLGADDYWLPEFLAECVTILENDQKCAGVYSDFIEWHPETEASWKIVRHLPDFSRETFMRLDYVNFSALVLRSTQYAYADPRWDPVADWELLLRLTQSRPLRHHPSILAVRRMHSGQTIARRRVAMVLKSFLLSFLYSPRAALWRLGQALSWPVAVAMRGETFK